MSAGAGLVFKGSGFYLTDYGKNAHRGEGARPSGEVRRERRAAKATASSASKSKAPSRRAAIEVRAASKRSESKSPSEAESKSRVQAGRVEAGRVAAEAEHRRVIDGTDALRAELARAARALGAPADVAPLLERPRDPAFGDWATNLAMVLAKPLGQKPRDLAQRAHRARSISTRPGIASARDRGARVHQLPRRRRRASPRGSRALIAAGRAYGRIERGRAASGERRVRVARIPPDRCTSVTAARPRSATRSRRCSSGPAGASRASSTTTTPACRSRISRSACRRACASSRGADARDSRGRLSRRVHSPRSRSATSPSIRPTPNGDDLDAVRRFAVRELRKEQDRDLQAFGVKFDVVLPRVVALHRRPRRATPCSALVAARPHVREGRRALARARPTSATTRIA